MDVPDARLTQDDACLCSVAEYIQHMKFKNAAQAAAAGDSADGEEESKKGEEAGGGASAGAAGKQAAKTEEGEEEGDDDDDDDEDDEDFDGGGGSDSESEGYDAIEAMDPDAVPGEDDGDACAHMWHPVSPLPLPLHPDLQLKHVHGRG